MTKLSDNQVAKIVNVATIAYKGLLGVFALTVIITSALGDSQTFAATGDFGGFNAYICALRGLIGAVIGGLAVLMIIIAGIMYALSSGNDKGNLSMGTAKNMILSAITGVVFYMLSDALLGACGTKGGLIGEIFN